MSCDCTLRTANEYASELRKELPPHLFQPVLSRLWWLPFHVSVITASAAVLVLTDVHVAWRILIAGVIGHSFACLAFLGHEIHHQTVVKDRWLQDILGTACLLPFCLGPAHWRAWHNKLHHVRTNRPGDDPDNFGNVFMVRQNKLAQFIATFAPGSGYIRSWFFMSYWFTFQVVSVLFIHSKLYNYWPTQRRRRQILLYWGMVGFWLGVAAAVGPYNFAFIYVIPLAVGNAVLLMYIATNHLLCDETVSTNDPLANALSVSVPRWMKWIHLNFGYHVEHHVFPYMSPKHAPAVQAALIARHGTRYRQMPIWKAWYLLYKTPAVHLTQSELVNMRTGVVFSTLGPNGEMPAHVDTVSVPVRPRRRTAEEREKAIQLRIAHADELTPNSVDQPIQMPGRSARRKAA